MQISSNPYIKKHGKKIIIWTSIILILSVAIYFKGKDGYDLLLDKLELVEKEKLQEIETINDSLVKVSKDRLLKIKDLEDRETVVINDYYNEFINEKNRADRLQKEMDDLIFDLYSKYSLDSLAEHIRFRRR